MQLQLLLLFIFSFFSLAICGQNIPLEETNNQIVQTINLADLKTQLSPLQSKNSNKSPNDFVIVDLLQIDGSVELFEVQETEILPLNLKEAYPNIKTYKGQSISHPGKTTRFTLSEKGMIGFMRTGNELTFIEPQSITENLYYFKKNPTTAIQCMTAELESLNIPLKSSSSFSNGSQRKTYTVAIAATGELSAANGGTGGATSVIASLLNMLNDVYENEVGIRLQLFSNNGSIVFPNASTDPFNPASNDLSTEAWNGIVETIGNNGYDIGHVFHYLGTGFAGQGIAGIGVTCQNNLKGAGWSAYGSSGGFTALFDIAVHEFAHQFGASHSFYGTAGNCSQKSAPHSYEPGSGTTIMSYAGICETDNIGTGKTDKYFHTGSLEQIINYKNSGNGNNCGSLVSASNTPPTANAGSNKIIPVNTPFELTGVGTDTDGDNLTYCWEQFNTDGSFSNTAPNAAANFANKPLFRSFPPTENPVRSFPQDFAAINNVQIIGEILSKVPQTATFRLTVRDNSEQDGNSLAGGIACDEMTVQFVGNANSNPTDAFYITSPNSATTWNTGSNVTVNWNVGVSDNASINCNNVDILLSNNNGQSFDYTLASNTPNDGSHTFTAPSLPSSSSLLIKIKCSNNVFFDINNAKITLNNTACAANGSTFSPDNNVTGNYGTNALDLNLSPGFGTPQTSTTLIIDANDPTMTTTLFSGVTCQSFSGLVPHYETFDFHVNTDGQYNFVFDASTPFPYIMNLYNTSFDDTNPCLNWVGSSAVNNNGTANLTTSLAANLSRGTRYVLVVTGFDDTHFGTYKVNFSNNVGGTIYNGTVPPPTGYAYTYVAVDANENIAAVNASADFTSLVDGTYSIYGFSYNTASINPNGLVGNNFNSEVNSFLNGNFCGNFSTNNLSLNILCPTENCGGPSNYPENISLTQGWNLVSTSCVPNDLAMESIWAPIASQVVEVKDLTGSYIPSFGFNGIGNWDLLDGYLVKMNSNQTLTIDCVEDIDYVNTPISLQSGWNMVAYLGNNPTDAATALASIAPNIAQVKDLTGTYIPSFGFNNLNNGTGLMIPGQGYQIKLSSADVLTYPGGLGKPIEGETPSFEVMEPVHFINNRPVNPYTAILAFPNMNDAPLQIGDEIGVFSNEGNLIGSEVYTGEALAILLYGNDPSEANQNGINEGNTYEIKVWSANTGTVHSHGIEYILGDHTFHTNAYTEVAFKNSQATNIETLEQTEIHLYPNPSKGTVALNIPSQQNQSIFIEVMDTKGKILLSQPYSINSNSNQVQLNLDNLTDGIYIVKVSGEEQGEEFLRLVLMR